MREMEGGEGRNINNIISSHSHSHNNQVGLDEMQQSQDHHQQQQQQQFQDSSNDDFLNQMLSNISNCSWPPTPHDIPSPSSNNPNTNNNTSSNNPTPSPTPTPNNIAGLQQMNEVTAKSLLLQHQQQFLMSRRPPGDAPPELLPSLFKTPGAAEASVQALYNGFAGSLQPPNQQHFHPPPPPPPQGGNMGGGPNFGGQGAAINQAPPASAASTGGSSGGAAPQRQRVRARRGQATDPHSIAERLRRERIAERMKGLQELVPNANKTDKASMLDEIIDYVKFLQLQVKVLSMSRLGGAAAVAPRVADLTSEEGGVGRGSNANQTTPPNDSMTVTEHQVAKLMEEDMGSAMQYLQGKGLCLMPISLATAISTATSITRTPLPPPRPHITNNAGAHHDITNNHHPLLPCISPSNDEGDNNANNPNSDPSLKDP